GARLSPPSVRSGQARRSRPLHERPHRSPMGGLRRRRSRDWRHRAPGNHVAHPNFRKVNVRLDIVKLVPNNAAITPSNEEPMAPAVVSTCPVCSGERAVSRLRCSSCGTTLEGDFSVGRFARLSREQMALLESFLRSRGNLRDIERELGISYPTVRARV